MNYLFVSGMFRSGTTLLGRILNAHENISLASDPCLPFFKYLRSDIAKSLGQEIDTSSPLSDYYFSKEGSDLLDSILATNLDQHFQASRLKALQDSMRAYGSPFSPLMMESIENVSGQSYAELFQSLMALVHKTYGNEITTGFVGVKEVWADEFIPALARTFPDAKFIQIVRDPRAVASSKNSTEQAYPWLFLGRQWRKLASLALLFSESEFKDRILLVRYEDLVNDAQASCNRICTFLDIPFDESMVEPGSYKDGAGKTWVQNTSYGDGTKEFNRKNVDRWREKLTKPEIDLIDILCGLEMLFLGYTPENTYPNQETFNNPPHIDEKRIASWIKNIYPNGNQAVIKEMEQEKVRLQAFNNSKPLTEHQTRQMFLNSKIFDLLKNGNMAGNRRYG